MDTESDTEDTDDRMIMADNTMVADQTTIAVVSCDRISACKQAARCPKIACHLDCHNGNIKGTYK